MKRFLMMLAAGLMLITVSPKLVKAQVVVAVKPARPAVVIAKPAKARAGFVWVSGHWRWSKRQQRYVWTKGQWVRAQRGKTYVAGRWKRTPKGWVWVPGHWRRR